VSQTRQDQTSQRHKRAECRKGRHLFGTNQNIGAGINRRVCEVCAAVTIDLTNTYELAQPVISSHSQLVSIVNR
jgi:hypothetical protein